MDEQTRKIYGNGYLNIPLEFQLGLLGIDEKIIKKLTGKNVLDIGCGNAVLVESLRQRGINAEGIDPEAEDKSYLIRQNITGTKPMTGAIPRPDNHYSRIFALQVPPLNRAFTFGGQVRGRFADCEEEMEFHESQLMQGQFIIYEAMRTLKEGGSFVAYPSLVRLDEVMGSLLRLQGINYYHEGINRRLADEYIAWESNHLGMPCPPQQILEKLGIYERTVLKPKA